MYSNEEQQQENILESANIAQRKSNKSSAPPPFIDNRPETQAYGALQKMADNGKQHEETAQLQKMANDHADQQQSSMPKPNNTGLPDHLKAGIENLSGYSMDDVKVHYNSDKPAQLQAHAYAQGTDIHIGSGQEKHLPHEAWHVVQQKQGRVKPTMQMKGGVDVNDDTGLEREADVMGKLALNTDKSSQEGSDKKSNVNEIDTVQLLVAAEMHIGRTYRYTLNGEERRSQLRQIAHGGWYTFLNGDKVRGAANVIEEVPGVDHHDEVPVSAMEETLACWNWAIYALNDTKSVEELEKVFTLLERQVPFERGGSEWLPVLDEEHAKGDIIDMYRVMCNARVEKGTLTRDDALRMIEDYTAKVEEVSVFISNMRDELMRIDLGTTTKEAITQEYNYRLTAFILQDAGYRVLPRDTPNTWKIGQHVQKGTFGWEHWWLRDPHGNYIDHFPGVGNGIRRSIDMPFEYGDDDIIEVPIEKPLEEHMVKADLV